MTDSEDDRFDRVGLGRSGSARTAHSSRRINRPASEMSLPINGGGGGAYGEHHPPLPVSHGVGGVGADGRRSSHYQQQPSHLSSSSTVASSSRYPTTTTATKSRRSTLLSQATTVYTDYPTSEEEEILAPPAPSRYNASSFAAINKNTYPSPPSSVVSSVSPQLFPETPAQAKARRQQEQAARPVLPTPARAPPPLSTTLGGGGLGGGSTYGGGGGGYSEKGGGGSTTSKGGSYVPSRWRDEKKGKIGAVEEEYRPPVEDKDWTCVPLSFLCDEARLTLVYRRFQGLVVPTTLSDHGGRSRLPSGSASSGQRRSSSVAFVTKFNSLV